MSRKIQRLLESPSFILISRRKTCCGKEKFAGSLGPGMISRDTPAAIYVKLTSALFIFKERKKKRNIFTH